MPPKHGGRAKTRCPKGPDCPFQHEQQHTSEFSHDGPRPSHWDQLGPGQHLSGPSTDKKRPAPLTERNSEVGSSPSTSDVDQYCVHQIQGLGSAENDKVVKLLEKVAWQVRPIMIKYKWRVGLLLELKPEDMSRGGDNMNRGQQVRLKVRQPGGGFYDFDHVLLVMLHELCHNRHGKHDATYNIARCGAQHTTSEPAWKVQCGILIQRAMPQQARQARPRLLHTSRQDHVGVRGAHPQRGTPVTAATV